MWGFQRRDGSELRVGRLRLLVISDAMLEAEKQGDTVVLGRLLGARLARCRITGEWPPEHWEPHVFELILKQYDERPETVGWHRYVLLREGWFGWVLVGAVGAFPRAEGDAEMGYSTLPEFQRRGIATRAVGELVRWLLGQAGVRSVSAQTYPAMVESVKVMERCGLSWVGDGDEAGTVRYKTVVSG